MNLLELPDNVLDEIFQHLSYDEIAKNRLVSTKINRICQSLLNRGAVKLKSYLDSPVLQILRETVVNGNKFRSIMNKQKLNSNLMCISLILRTYKDYIDKNLCCFIPGKVIDISLSLLKMEDNICPMAYIDPTICMATRHFKEQIEPPLRKLKDQKYNTSMGIGLSRGHFRDTFVSNVKPSMQKAPATDFRKEYFRLNRKYSTLLNRVHLTNEKLRKVNLSCKIIKKQLTNSRKEVADLRRRLEKWESQNASANGKQTDKNQLVTKTDFEKAGPVRSNKRSAASREKVN